MNLHILFEKLKTNIPLSKEGYYSYKIDRNGVFRLAIDSESNPCLLISQNKLANSRSENKSHTLKKLDLKFNIECNILELETDNEISSTFSIVTQINGNSRMHDYFLRVIEGIILELQKDLSLSRLNTELDYLISLFSSPKKIDQKKLLGLWGELIFILSSDDVEKSILAWHSDPNNLFDFSYNHKKVEIKTTLNNTRVHTFNNKQLNSFKKLEVKVVSILTEKAALGKSVLELWKELRNICKSSEICIKLDKTITEVISLDLEALDEIRYDQEYALSTIKEFNSADIPNIDELNIPNEVVEIKIKVNLEAIK